MAAWPSKEKALSNTLYKLQSVTMAEPPAVPPLQFATSTRTYTEVVQTPVYEMFDSVTGQSLGRVAVRSGEQLSATIRGIRSVDVAFRNRSGTYTGQVRENYVAFIQYYFVGYELTRTLKTEKVVYDTPGRPIDRTPKVTVAQNAWDAYAWSNLAMRSTMRVKFNVGDGPQQLIAGISALQPEPGAPKQSFVAHGFLIDGQTAYVHSAKQYGIPPAPGSTNYFRNFVNLVGGEEFRVGIHGGMAFYFVDADLIASMPSNVPGLDMRLGAVLYSPESTVTEPDIEPWTAGGRGTLVLQLGAIGSQGGYSQGAVSFGIATVASHRAGKARIGLHIRGSGRAVANTGTLVIPGVFTFNCFGYSGKTARGTLVLPAVHAIGAESGYAQGTAKLYAITSGNASAIRTSNDALVVTLDTMVGDLATFPHRSVGATVGASGAFSAQHVPAVRLTTRASGRSRYVASLIWFGELAAKTGMDVLWRGQRVMDVSLVGDVDSVAGLQGLLVVTADLDAQATAQASLTSARMLLGSMAAGAQVDVGMSASQVLEAALSALTYGGVSLLDPGAAHSVWSVLPENGASASYESFPFNSFARIGGRNYGASDTGIYELEGGDDAGAPIHASIHLGKRNFDSPALKGISYAYLGVSSTGRMVVRVTAPDGKSYLYQTRRSDDYMATQRADFGKGLRAHFLGLEIYNQDGADFTLDKLEFVVNELKRRI